MAGCGCGVAGCGCGVVGYGCGVAGCGCGMAGCGCGGFEYGCGMGVSVVLRFGTFSEVLRLETKSGRAHETDPRDRKRPLGDPRRPWPGTSQGPPLDSQGIPQGPLTDHTICNISRIYSATSSRLLHPNPIVTRMHMHMNMHTHMHMHMHLHMPMDMMHSKCTINGLTDSPISSKRLP